MWHPILMANHGTAALSNALGFWPADQGLEVARRRRDLKRRLRGAGVAVPYAALYDEQALVALAEGVSRG